MNFEKISKSRPHIQRIEGQLIPGTPNTEWQGDHFFVNVWYVKEMPFHEAHEILEVALRDSQLLMAYLSSNIKHANYRSLCLSFYANSKNYSRILRFSIPLELIQEAMNSLPDLADPRILLTSEVPAIEKEILCHRKTYQ